MCKRLLLVTTAVAVAMLGGAAQAADMPLKAPPRVAAAVYDWTGFYVGINGGWARGDLDWTFATDQRANQRFDGGFFGGHVGAQVQFHNNLVLGVEFNILGGDLDGSTLCENPDFRCSSKVDRLWTAGPRAGFAVNNVLFYGTGGYASGRVRTDTLDVSGISPPFPPDFTDVTHRGWFAGGGIEYGITPNLIAGVEFTHVDLGSRTHTTSIPASPDLDRNVSADFNTIRGRLSYKFAVPGMSR
jgi:outer membrane immunogenic protein